MADFSLQTLVSGGSAILAGGANVIPCVCLHIFNLWSAGRLTDAVEAQSLLSGADWVLTKTAIPGTKSVLQTYYGYGGYARRPLERLTETQAEEIAGGIKEAMEMEETLPVAA